MDQSRRDLIAFAFSLIRLSRARKGQQAREAVPFILGALALVPAGGTQVLGSLFFSETEVQILILSEFD